MCVGVRVVRVCVRVCRRLSVCVHVRACVPTGVHTCVHTRVHTRVHTCVRTCVHACVHKSACVGARLRVCTHVRVCRHVSPDVVTHCNCLCLSPRSLSVSLPLFLVCENLYRVAVLVVTQVCVYRAGLHWSPGQTVRLCVRCRV